MSTFSESNFVKKLADLNHSQQSIQTLSLWLIHHRKHSKTVVDVWLAELINANPKKKLVFLYLANDVVQNSKKKGPEYIRDFKTVLQEAYTHTASQTDEKTKGSMGRMVNIWKERGVFDEEFINSLKAVVGGATSGSASASAAAKKKPKPAKPIAESNEKKSKAQAEPAPTPAKKKKKEMTLTEETEQQIENGASIEPPEAEELVQALQDLENQASSDAGVRERIAALPQDVSDVSLLDKIEDKEAAERLAVQVEDARQLLVEYNSRLASELEERKRVALLLRNFISAQKEALLTAEEKLQEHKEKLQSVSNMRKELKAHLQSLPDLTLLPDVTGLAPLPSASDLFTKE